MLIQQSDIESMDKRFRVHFINSLSGYKSANLVGTQDKEGRTNLSIVSSVFHLGADPALMGMIIRPRSVPRHTFDNLTETGFYTINQVHQDFYQQAHQTSARFDKSQSEFDMLNFEAEYVADFFAPFVKQSKLKIGLELVETQTLAVNDTELVIGKIVCVELDEKAVKEDGFVDLSMLGAVAVNGLDGYCTAQLIDRMAYAKPDKSPSLLVNEICVEQSR